MNIRKKDEPKEEKKMSGECFVELIAAREGLNGILSSMYIPYCTRKDIDVMALKLSIARAQRHLDAAKAVIGPE